jgi:hypothetical protein
MPPLRRFLSRMLLPACLVLAPAPWAGAQAGPAQQSTAPDLLLFEVRLEQQVLSDALTAFRYGDDVYLPLGELSKLLTIAISTQPVEGRASGYVLDEQRSFSLDVLERRALIDGRAETVDRAQFKLHPDDIYVASRLLARWLPVDLSIDMSGLLLNVRPREQLPLQARLARRGRGQQSAAGNRPSGPDFPRQATPYAPASAPFIDQTLGLEARRGSALDASYTAYLTGDLLGMQGALYASSSRSEPGPELRLTLGRNDPDAGLLGPLHARSAMFGSVAVPGVSGISAGSSTGNGLAVGNRPLYQPGSFDRHTLQGNLPPGWDVELYFNDALVGVQQSRADGKYSFEDQPLVYGPNEFRLVFHGPLGQVRVERQTFLLEQSQVAPGQLLYHVAGHRTPDGELRSAVQFDLGLAGGLSATGGMVRMPLAGVDQRYTNLGLRRYWSSFVADVGAVKAGDGGSLAQAQLKTRIGGLSVSAAHSALRDFRSEIFQPLADPIKARDELRVDGVLAGESAVVPLSLQVRRDRLASSASNTEVLGRISAYRHGTAVSNALRWQSLDGQKFAEGSLQVSRRMAGIGVTGQLQYGLKPVPDLSVLTLAVDKYLDDGYLLNLGVLRSFREQHYDFNAALNKSLGSFGLGVNAHYSTSGDYGAGVQLFVAMGLEPRSGAWRTDALPLANTGAASIRVFLDKNMNGRMDAGEEAVKGAGFTVNGGSQPVRTDGAGIAYLNRLPPDQQVDIGLDISTLEDPQWMARQPGVRIVPRPGKVSQLEFPVIVTGEVDGTTYLIVNGARRGIGDLELELVDRDRKVAGVARSASDGYFILNGVAPGEYLMRVSRQQLQRLGLTDMGSHLVTIGPDGTVLNGRDLYVERGDAAASRPVRAAAPAPDGQRVGLR